MNCSCLPHILNSVTSSLHCSSISHVDSQLCLRLEHEQYCLYALLLNNHPASEYIYTELSRYLIPILRQNKIIIEELTQALRLLDLDLEIITGQSYTDLLLITLVDCSQGIIYLINAGGGILTHIDSDSIIHQNTQKDANLTYPHITIEKVRPHDHVLLNTLNFTIPMEACALLLSEYPAADVANALHNKNPCGLLLIVFT